MRPNVLGSRFSEPILRLLRYICNHLPVKTRHETISPVLQPQNGDAMVTNPESLVSNLRDSKHLATLETTNLWSYCLRHRISEAVNAF
ncbi:hypothetical protein Poly41_48780 [Novipirellula artificiosorum]|uniref:Uncharacterized protein n=1 Tax=Novipirellula artificiosorum TaxID=2528016 RepID=A0A5C6DB33_9BACT|nr:hypothetical protein Poly41_48780 [Novipirellula artificiosorum]